MIAVLDRVVVGHGPQLDSLVERLGRRYPKNYKEIAVEYIAGKEMGCLQCHNLKVMNDEQHQPKSG